MNDMTKREFDQFRQLIYDRLGISLSDKKVSLLQSRLGKIVQKKGMNGYKDLYNYFNENNGTIADIELEDAVTTNVTSFFREAQQWIFLKDYLNTHVQNKRERKLRIWSAACSSGEEPYSIAIFLEENLKDFASWDIKILASDISDDILKKAMKGSYSQREMEGVPRHIVQKYFTKTSEGNSTTYTISQRSKNMITFRKFNLVYGDYGIFSNPMDMIFCRNVMIYFDKQVQTKIDNHLSNILCEDGLLFIGHSESIPVSVRNLKLANSSIYKKQ